MNIEDKFTQSEIGFNNKFDISDNNKNSSSQEKQNGVASFGGILKSYVDDTNKKMTDANSTTEQFIKGENVSIDDVMIKNQEASLNLQFLAQTRDKLLDGYNQLIKMQL